jgi:colicin import membrane protein
MARRLKTYQTSSGFFDLAIAAPSMKAAAEAWGSRINVFKQGFAKEIRDPATVAATMAKPGVVLRRPVGSNGPFTEHADLPKDLPIEKVKARPTKPQKLPTPPKIEGKAARAAALAFEREQKRREMERRKEEAARERGGNIASRRLQRQKGRLNKLSWSTRRTSKRLKKIALHSTDGRKRRTRGG